MTLSQIPYNINIIEKTTTIRLFLVAKHLMILGRKKSLNRKKHLAGRDLLQLAGDCREGIVVITSNIQALITYKMKRYGYELD